MPWRAQFFSRRRRYEDISISIQEHIDERTEELMADGISRTQAEQTARREFGNVTLVEESSREVWQWPALESILADLKFAFRRLGKSPGFAATVLLTLAIGIGANTVVFSVVNGVLLKPLPYPDSEQLVSLWLNAPGAGGLANFSNGLQLSTSMYLTFSEHNRTFQSMGIWTPSNTSVTGVGEPEQVPSEVISDGVLQTLDVPPAVGRWFTQADQDPHGAKTVMLSYGYWQRRFGGDRNVIGRVIQVDAQSREIVGIMPRGFRLVDRDFDLLVPLAPDRAHQVLAGFGFSGIARLKPGISIAQADADVARLISVWMDSYSNGPGTNPHFYERWRISPGFRSLKQQVIGSIGGVLWVVMATVGLVMLIVCTNVANLLLVRAESRHQELSIRAALGASRMRIARELLIESVSLGLIGGVIAIGVAVAGLRLLIAFGPTNLPRLSEISLDARSLGFTLALSVLSGLLFGSISALRYARTQASATMASATRTASIGRARQRSRNVLVTAQVSMALVLLVSAVLMIRTFAALRNVEPGFADPQHVQTMHIWIPDLLISDPLTATHVQNNIVDKLAAIPGVTAVGFAGAVPMENNDPNWDGIHVEGKIYEGGELPLRLFNFVSPAYSSAMGTRLVSAIVNWVARENVGDLFMEVGGLLTPVNEHVSWIRQKRLRVGDKIQIRVIDATSVDKPKRKKRPNPAYLLRARKLYVRKMAKEFGWEM
jgi:predicted permease